MDSVSIDIVKGLLSVGKSYDEISVELQQVYPNITRGLSARSVRRYVKEKGLKEIVKHEVIEAVKDSVSEVGETYGRKMMKGYVRASKGIAVSERTLKQILPAVAPVGHYSRQTFSQERSNPSIYSARYFGHKLHVDQNEKLVQFGVTYVMARDGFSGKIISAAVMARKNNLIIYENIYRAAVTEFGLWDQVRVDYGREFYLMLYVQEKLRSTRGDATISPYVQTTSTCNHIIERIWVELNQRVTYPVKRVVTSMENREILNMSCPVTKFCVSHVLRRVCQVGMQRMIQAWNSHPIPRRGVPNTLQAQYFHTTLINPVEIPQTSACADEYRQQGGSLADPRTYGTDPLEDDDDLCRRREDRWHTMCGMDVDAIFSQLISGNHSVLENAITAFIDLTSSLADEV